MPPEPTSGGFSATRPQPPPLEPGPSAPPGQTPPFDLVATPVQEQPPVRWREILAVLLLVVVSDVTLYRACGFAGYGAFFLVAPLLLCLGAPRPRLRTGFWLLGLMLALLVAKMLWCGSWLLAGSGFALLVALAMVLAGLRPYVLETVVFASQTVLAGYEGLIQYRRSSERMGPVVTRGGWLNLLMPLAALVAFGLLFIVANPDLLTSFGETMERFLNALRDWILHLSPTWQEVLFWFAVLWIAVGLLRPAVTRALFEETPPGAPAAPETAPAPVRALLYVPFRNTLVTVIALFAVYLGFEFKTLWFTVFRENFYYSGYAHEGAAWLTVALALATLILSLIFRGRVLRDARLGRLRSLAWIWSLENMLLAVAVYHRLCIYVGFNGMTRMRTVGFFGMTCVVAGFVLVVWKILRSRDFVWLLRRHLWAVALTVYLFALTPVDAIVHWYNVRRILSGDPAPSVQISVHPISAEGVPRLLPLVDCDDAIIREGVRAMLAARLDEAESLALRSHEDGWTTYQAADRLMLDRLRAESGRWAEYQDPQKREAALKAFHEYAYGWY